MNKMTSREVQAAVITGGFTSEQLNEIQTAITYARAQLAAEVKRTFGVGDSVKWKSSKAARGTMTGVITKMNRKTIIVKTTAYGSWRVSASMLEAA